MRVLVDHSAAFNQHAGIGRYARSIMPACATAFPEAEFTVWWAPDGRGRPPFADAAIGAFPASTQVQLREGPIFRRQMDRLLFRLRCPIPFQALAGRGDVAYSPDFTVPHLWGGPEVVTIHDLAFEITPEFAPEALRRYLGAAVPRAAHRAAHVMTVSETTKRDVMERLNLPSERIKVAANAADSAFFAAEPLSAATKRLVGLPDDYLLIVGTIEPRKNHLTLFRALEAAGSRIDLPLVVVGRVGWSANPILAAARPLQAAGRVILLDYVEERLLPGIYAGAAALVYPSWYEGFGLPIVEALAVGVPVVASDVPAHREVGGGEPVWCEPGDAESIAAAIERSLAQPGRRSEEGRRRTTWARTFDWSTSGQRLATTLRSLSSP